MSKAKGDRVNLPVVHLNEDQTQAMNGISTSSMVSKAAVLRQALSNFLDMPIDQQQVYIERDYGSCKAYTNAYTSQEMATRLDALVEKFEVARNQVIRAAVEKFIESEKKGGD